jgi:hypothetical protein
MVQISNARYRLKIESEYRQRFSIWMLTVHIKLHEYWSNFQMATKLDHFLCPHPALLDHLNIGLVGYLDPLCLKIAFFNYFVPSSDKSSLHILNRSGLFGWLIFFQNYEIIFGNYWFWELTKLKSWLIQCESLLES